MENIERMNRLREQGFSYWKIADILNSMGVPTKTRKGPWQARSVQQILERMQTVASNEDAPTVILEEA
jgi:hypothetical protein